MPPRSSRQGWKKFMSAWMPNTRELSPPRRRSPSTASDDTIDIPREFPPPTLAPKTYHTSYGLSRRRQDSAEPVTYTEPPQPPERQPVKVPERVPLDEYELHVRGGYSHEQYHGLPWYKRYVHRCSQCHRLRSWGYHRAHPLRHGDLLVAGVCSRCRHTDQHDGGRSPVRSFTSSTHSSDGDSSFRCTRIRFDGSPTTITVRRYRRYGSTRTDNGKPAVPAAANSTQASKQSTQGDPKASASPSKANASAYLQKAVCEDPPVSPKAVTKNQEPTFRQPQGSMSGFEEYHSRLFRQGSSETEWRTYEPHRCCSCQHQDYRAKLNDSREKPTAEDRIASHPRSWSHGLFYPINVFYRERETERVITPPREPSPPEYFYRATVRRSSPHPGFDRNHPIRSPVMSGALPLQPFEAHDAYGYDDGSVTPPRKRQDEKPQPQANHEEKSKSKTNDAKAEPHRHSARSRHRPVYSDSEDDGDPRSASRVRFAPVTRTEHREQTREHVHEALQDDREARRDKGKFEHTKDKVRKAVKKGGGHYELH